MSFTLENGVVMVTGAATGLGKALALHAASAGAKIAAVDIISPDDTVAEITNGGGTAGSFTCDVRAPKALANLAEEINNSLGRVNIVCANAGSSTGICTIETATIDDFRTTYELNVFGVFNTLSAFLPGLRALAAESKTAAIMITGSEHSLGIPSTSPSLIAYTSSKHALVGLAGCCRRDLAGTGITVSLLCPGWIATENLKAGAANNEFLAKTLAAYGQEPAEVARLAFAGLTRGDLFITTNPASRNDGLKEHQEILDAIAALPSS